MSYSFPCKLLVIATLFSPLSTLAQSGGGGSGGSSGGASGGPSGGGMSGAGAPSAGSAGAGATAINGVTGPANAEGLNNSGNDPGGVGNAAKASNTPAPIRPGQPIRLDRRPQLELRPKVQR
jgi:hypothetical protein